MPDLLLVLGVAFLFYETCQVFLRRWESLLVTLLMIGLLGQDWIFSLIRPWNTIPTHFLGYLVIFLYLKREVDGG